MRCPARQLQRGFIRCAFAQFRLPRFSVRSISSTLFSAMHLRAVTQFRPAPHSVVRFSHRLHTRLLHFTDKRHTRLREAIEKEHHAAVGKSTTGRRQPGTGRRPLCCRTFAGPRFAAAAGQLASTALAAGTGPLAGAPAGLAAKPLALGDAAGRAAGRGRVAAPGADDLVVRLAA